MRKFYFSVLLAFIALTLILSGCNFADANWRTASRARVGLAPDPENTPEAIVQIYSARAFGWRGYFGVHTWVAVKPSLAKHFTVYEVIGWYLRRGGSVLSVQERAPDHRWFGNMPELLVDRRGKQVDALINRIQEAANGYPYQDRYTIWPGPNSNTFTAWVARSVPELGLDLPPTAIGKDFLEENFVATAPSGTGWQFSLFGLLGVIVSEVEGIELNFLGLSFGVDMNPLALKLPLIGRIDFTSDDS